MARYIEKPDAETAERYVGAGYLWNSGIFMFSAATFIEELERLRPDILSACRQALVDSFVNTVADDREHATVKQKSELLA